jgi:hypothetical protein
MTFSHINRRTATVLTAIAALGTAGPAAARQIGSDGQVPVTPPVQAPHYGKANVLPLLAHRHMDGLPETTAAPVVTATAHPTVTHPAPGSDLTYVLVGGVVIAVAGLGGTLAANRRRAARTATAARPRIAG